MTARNVVLHVADVHKRFGGLHALADVDLQVEEGTTHAIIGPNGAGKSTLLTPTLAGGYRLFVYVYDGQNHAAHANIPFYVR